MSRPYSGHDLSEALLPVQKIQGVYKPPRLSADAGYELASPK